PPPRQPSSRTSSASKASSDEFLQDKLFQSYAQLQSQNNPSRWSVASFIFTPPFTAEHPKTPSAHSNPHEATTRCTSNTAHAAPTPSLVSAVTPITGCSASSRGRRPSMVNCSRTI